MSNPAADHVAALLEAEQPIASWINLGEVFYVIRRAAGEDAAASMLRDLGDVVAADTPTEFRIIEAARIKADHPMAYADAFAAATAMAHDATLWTGDPELLLTGAAWLWRDLRSSSTSSMGSARRQRASIAGVAVSGAPALRRGSMEVGVSSPRRRRAGGATVRLDGLDRPCPGA